MAEQKGFSEELGTPQIQHAKRIGREENLKNASKKDKKPISEHYEVRGKKLVKIETARSGNEYSTFIGNAEKCGTFIKDLEKSGKLKKSSY